VKYRALRTIAVVFKVLGWITIVLGVLSSCAWAALGLFGGLASLSALSGSELDSSATAGILSGGVIGTIAVVVGLIIALVITAVYALLLFAASEGIYVFLDIERNTREAAELLKR